MAEIQCPYCETLIDLEKSKVKTRWRVLEVLSCEEEGTAGLMEAKAPSEIPEGYIATTYECSGCRKTVIKANPVVPRDIAASMEEAILCFSVRAYNAAVVMFGRTVQASTMDRGGIGASFVAQLQSLSKMGKLSGGAEDWTHAVRIIGNLGAHPDRDHQEHMARERAEGAFLLALAYLQAVYIEPPSEHVDRLDMRHTWWGEKCVHGFSQAEESK